MIGIQMYIEIKDPNSDFNMYSAGHRGLMHHVLDQEVGGSNTGKSVSLLPGSRLDLPTL